MSVTFWFQLFGAISMGITLLTVVGKVLIVNPLKHYIKEQTYSIQPDANGGKSLPDVAKNVIEIKIKVEDLVNQIDRVEGRLDTHIEQHVEGKA